MKKNEFNPSSEFENTNPAYDQAMAVASSLKGEKVDDVAEAIYLLQVDLNEIKEKITALAVEEVGQRTGGNDKKTILPLSSSQPRSPETELRLLLNQDLKIRISQIAALGGKAIA